VAENFKLFKGNFLMIQYGYNPAMRVGGPKCGIHNNRVRQPDRGTKPVFKVLDFDKSTVKDSFKIQKVSWWLKSWLYAKRFFSWKR
jgi:hypothetical protein